MNTLKKLSLAALALSGLTLVGCLQNEDTASMDNAPLVQLTVTTNMPAMKNNLGGLSKANLISYAKLYITVASPTPGDTIRDSVAPGSNGFSATSTILQTVLKNYTVKGLRNYTVTAWVKDTKDSITHVAVSTSPTPVKLTDVVAFPITLVPKFTMYQANFTLPDSLKSSVSGTFAQRVNFKRLVLFVDGAIKGDSTHATYFTPLVPFTFNFDYVTVGTHTIRLVAMGNVGVGVAVDTLFSGSTSITSSAGTDSTVPLTLVWKGNSQSSLNQGADSVRVTIGLIGKTIVNGTTLPNVVPKVAH